MSSCLVTGGAGFIGSHLVDGLLENGHAVRVIDNLSTGNLANLAHVRDRIEMIEGDITNSQTVNSAMHGVDLIFHQAALASVPRSVADPVSTNRVCVDGTLNVLLAARSPVICGDGQQSRDFTYVADAVQANLRAATAPKASGKVYNVACGSRTSLLELVAKINALLGTNLQPIHEKPRPGDVKHSQADITPAKIELGYSPQFDIDQGLRKCLDYFRARKK